MTEESPQPSKRAQRRAQSRKRAQREQTTRYIIFALLIAALGWVIFGNNNSNAASVFGSDVEPMESANHVPEGTIIEYDTHPPTSGEHYDVPMPAKFYDEDDPAVTDIVFPIGHIVHSLEHGYVVIWYNCSILTDAECQTLKDQVKAVIEDMPTKTIGFPYTDMDTPIALTSWAQMLILESFDEGSIRQYIQDNRSHPRSPEPNAQ